MSFRCLNLLEDHANTIAALIAIVNAFARRRDILFGSPIGALTLTLLQVHGVISERRD